MAYYLHNDKGVMIIKIPNDVAQIWISKLKGYFTKKKFRSGTVATCFVINENDVWIGSKNVIQVMIDSGYYLQPE